MESITKINFRHNKSLLGFTVVLILVSMVAANILPLARKQSSAADSFLANWDQGSLDAFVGNGDTTAFTDGTLPDLVDGGFGGSGQAMQASRGDTLRYSTAGNLDNNKVEYSMQLKNKYELSVNEQSVLKFYSPADLFYDNISGFYYILDNNGISSRVIKTMSNGSGWQVLETEGLSNPKGIYYDRTTDYIYIANTGFNSIVKTKIDGTGWQILSGFNKPNSLTYDAETEMIYVSDTYNNRIVRTKIDGSEQTVLGSLGSGVMQFNKPWGIDYDHSTGYLYIADGGNNNNGAGTNNRVVRTNFAGDDWTTLDIKQYDSYLNGVMDVQYDSSTGYLYVAMRTCCWYSKILKTKIDGSNSTLLSVSYNFDYFLFHDSLSDVIYYPDATNGMIRQIKIDNTNASSFGTKIVSSGINSPNDVWFDEGNLNVSDGGNFRIIGAMEDGSKFVSFGERNCDGASGHFGYDTSPVGIHVDATTKDIYSYNRGSRWCPNATRQVIKTNLSNSYWQAWITDGNYGNGRPFYDGSQYVYWPYQNGSSTGAIRKLDTISGNSTSLGGFSTSAQDLWVDSATGYLYVADTGNDRIVKTLFDGTDQVILTGVNDPTSVQYDETTEFLYVADKSNHRILKTKIDGTDQTTLGGFNSPQGVYYDASTDYLYVADTGNNRIVKTKIDGTGWENLTLDPRRVLFKTQGDEMRLELDLYSQRLKFWMKKATGGIFLQSEPLNWGIDEWHKPAVSFNRATGRVELKIDDVVVDSADDMTWTTSLPSFGDYIYLSTDPSNPDAVNVSPVDDFRVEVETVDTIDPSNPTAAHTYNDSGKSIEYADEAWGNAPNPYFEFSGATDDSSGVLGYWVYFGPTIDGDPITSGAYQAHTGPPDAIQNYTSNLELVSGTTYYLRVRTRDNDYNYSEPSTLITYKYDGGSPSPPEYINASPQGCSTASTFTFSWPKAEEEVSGLVGYEYKKGTQGTAAMVPDLNMDDLMYAYETTPYQEGDNVFYLRAKDNAGNVSTWQTAVFCSTGLTYIIDGPTIESGPSSMTVSWTSSKKTTGFIEVKDANSYREPQGHRDYQISHQITVTGLKSEREYQYRIVWEDENKNDGESEWFTTTTQTLPQISNLSAEVVSPTKAIVSWTTNYPSSGELTWGSGANTRKVEFTGLTTSFYYQIDNLSGGNTYILSAKCTTSDGADYTAGSTFQTPPLPIIYGIKFEPITDQTTASMRASWITNIETTSTVLYGPKGENKKELTSSDKSKEHEMIIADLFDNTEYEMYASGMDQWGNIATSEVNTFKTALDTRPAIISTIVVETSNVGLDKQDKAQIAISWLTDEPATSMVEYGEGIAGSEYTSKTTEDTALTTNHLVIIPDLTPNKPYHIRVVSTDKGSNISRSDDHTVIPGDVPRSALQIILSTFTRLFGWMGELL